MVRSKYRKGSLVIICLIIISMMTSISVFAATDNLLVDPDWENGMTGWVIEADNATASRNGETLKYSSAYQDVPLAEPAGGQKLILSAQLKADPSQECIEMELIICKADGSHISDLMESESGTEWTYHEILTAVPTEASYARVYLTIWKDTDASTFGFSDLTLNKVQTNVSMQQQDGSLSRSDMQDTSNIARHTFTGRDDVVYSAPVDLFATRVIETTPGSPWTDDKKNQNPLVALGLPDYYEGSGLDYCMGAGGSIVLGFDKALYDGPGIDIYVFEAANNEEYKVEVSNDLVNWYELGSATGNGGFNMNGIVPAGSSFQYVKVTDTGYTINDWPGADVDAVCGFYGIEIEPADEDAITPDIGTVGSIPSNSTGSYNTDSTYLKSLVEQGKGYYYGTGPEGYNRDKAEQCFKEAADSNYGEGWYYLGNMYMNSLMDQPYERAMECYQKAVDCGFGLGLVCQALLYENGLGVEQDFAKAYELYSAAVDVGIREGYCGLGNLYKDGNGVYQDELVAMEYYKMALDSQDFMWRNFAKCMIGDMYEEGAPGISQDYSQAMGWYLQAAEEGYGRGYCCVGDMYYYGNGVEKDQEEALNWFKQAAEHGNVTGMYDAGFLLDHALGVTQDYTEAMKYYRMAAGIGDASSMYALGCMYEEGHGVSKDYEQARYWLEQALKYAGDDMELKEAIGEEMAYISSGVY